MFTRFNVVCALLLLVYQVQAATLRLPLRQSKQDAISLANRGQLGDQAILQGDLDDTHDQNLPSTKIYSMLSLMIEVFVGRPEQLFYVALSFRQSDLYVISSRCNDRAYLTRRHYDSARSHEYVKNGTAVNVTFGHSEGRGFASQDTLKIGPVSIDEQNFVEATHIAVLDIALLIDCQRGACFEGQLGLGPKHGNSWTGAGNLVTNMHSQGLIDRNLFSMVLADEDEEGNDSESSLVFGGAHGGVDLDDVVMIPVTNATGQYLGSRHVENSWQVSAGYIQLGDGAVVNRTLSNYTAVIDVEYPNIAVPMDLAREIDDIMHARHLELAATESPSDAETSSSLFAPGDHLHCGVIRDMPDLVFSLGGKEFRVSAAYYIGEYTYGQGQKYCYSLLGGQIPGNNEGTIVLGLAFLKAFHTVFDLERDMVGFTERPA